eukprot:102407_1
MSQEPMSEDSSHNKKKRGYTEPESSVYKVINPEKRQKTSNATTTLLQKAAAMVDQMTPMTDDNEIEPIMCGPPTAASAGHILIPNETESSITVNTPTVSAPAPSSTTVSSVPVDAGLDHESDSKQNTGGVHPSQPETNNVEIVDDDEQMEDDEMEDEEDVDLRENKNINDDKDWSAAINIVNTMLDDETTRILTGLQSEIQQLLIEKDTLIEKVDGIEGELDELHERNQRDIEALERMHVEKAQLTEKVGELQR